jgi:ubiquinol oxidase
MVHVSSLALCSLFASAVSGFQLASPPRAFGIISLRAAGNNEAVKEAIDAEVNGAAEAPSMPDVEVTSLTAPVAVASSSSAAITANTMDEGIYNFNKILIDTVYDVICFLYPVRGNDRDFARFYVLETVARVPYFAYLSSMHLKETFGERYESMSDRMRTQ